MYKLPDNPGILTPSRMVGSDGTLYAMPYWIALENEAHWDAIVDSYDKSKKEKENSKIVHKVLNYIVTEDNGNFTCTCKGFMFRKNCRHVKHIRDGEPLEKR